MDLKQLGWDCFFERNCNTNLGQEYIVGRIACVQKNAYLVYTELGELWATITGRVRYFANSSNDIPAVGDWVILKIHEFGQCATIQKILPRRSQFSRQAAGKVTTEQIIATNIDTVFLVSGLDREFNLRRIERYLIQIVESGANPVILLNKTDLCDDVEQRKAEVETIALGRKILVLSAISKQGLNNLIPYLEVGQTVALVGSSGVGKSTLINQLVNREIQAVQSVRQEDSRGRHTTTSRELILLPSGGLIVDTPGMRELQMWRVNEGLSKTFADIKTLSVQCHFKNCQHESEPGCMVKQAIHEGKLSEKRWRNYQKLQRELKFGQYRQDQKAYLIEKKKWKKVSKLKRKNIRNKL